jgi:hypothetical protein
MRALRLIAAPLLWLALASAAVAQAPSLSLNLGGGPNDRSGAPVRDLFKAVQDNLNAVNAQVQQLGQVQKGPALTLGGDGPTPSLAGTGYQLYARRNADGTANQGVNLNLIHIPSDTATVYGPSFLNAFSVYENFGGSTVQGGRQGVQSIVNQTAPTSAGNANRNYVGGTFIAQTATGDGGTGLTYDPTGALPSQAQGGYFGINPVVITYPGATNILNASTGEFNIGLQAGSSVAYKSGIQISALGSDQVKGAAVDAMISLSNQFGAIGFRDGILFGPQNGSHPIDSNGFLLRSFGPGRATVGINALGVIASSNYAGTGTRPLYVDAAGTFSAVGSNVAPASSTSACQVGATAYTATFSYACVATNTWSRTAASTGW